MTYNLYQNSTIWRKLFQESRGNFKPCVQNLHIHILCTFYNLKRFILLSKQEIKITIHKTVVMTTILMVKISQNHIVSIKIMWYWIGKEKKGIMQETQSKMHKNIHIKRKKLAHISLSILIYKNATKRLKKHQETHGNFSGIFARKLTRTDSKSVGAYSKEVKKKWKEDPEPTVTGPNPRFRWIRIILGALGALDRSGWPKNRIQRLKRTGGWTGSKPTRSTSLYKGSGSGFFHFLSSSSLFSPAALLTKPNPNFSNLPRSCLSMA